MEFNKCIKKRLYKLINVDGRGNGWNYKDKVGENIVESRAQKEAEEEGGRNTYNKTRGKGRGERNKGKEAASCVLLHRKRRRGATRFMNSLLFLDCKLLSSSSSLTPSSVL